MVRTEHPELRPHTDSVSHIWVLCVQRYGLWDHKGPLEEEIPSPEPCKDEGKTIEGGDEDGGRKKAEGEDKEEKEGKVSLSSIPEKLQSTKQDQLDKVGDSMSVVLSHVPINNQLYRKIKTVHLTTANSDERF